MGLEAASFISELVVTNPVGSVDDYATADDHLRLIKAVLQGQFPNFGAAEMAASESELEILDGATLTTAELNKLAGLGASQAELDVLDGYTGDTADLNILSGADAGGLTAAELLFVAGVTSDIQAQFSGKAPSAHSHTGAEISALDAGDTTTGEFADARIPSLNASKINAGTFGDARIPSLNASKINAGTFADARIPSLNTSKITAGTFNNARISAGNVTQHLGAYSLTSAIVLDTGNQSIAGVKTFVSRPILGGGFLSHNAGANSAGTIRVQTGAPSGGSNGDIWLIV